MKRIITATILALVSLLLLSMMSCASVVRIVKNSDQETRIIQMSQSEANEVESTRGISFDPVGQQGNNGHYYLTMAGKTAELNTNGLINQAGTTVFINQIIPADAYFRVSNPQILAAGVYDGSLLGKKPSLMQPVENVYPVFNFLKEMTMQQSIVPESRTIKIGDSWSNSFSLYPKSAGMLRGQEGASNAYWYAVKENLLFEGVVEYKGRRYAIISVDRWVSIFNFYFEGNIGSDIYLNKSKLRLAYDYEQSKLVEVHCDGQYNAFIKGSVDNPLKLLGSNELSESIKKNIDAAKFGNAINIFYQSNTAIGSLVKGIAGMRLRNTYVKDVLPKLNEIPSDIIELLVETFINDIKLYRHKLSAPAHYQFFFREKNL